MNKKIIGASIAMLFAASGAYAQSSSGTSSVELYGILDAAVGSVQYSLGADPNFPATVNPVSVTSASAIKNSTTGLFNGGISPSRFGIRGTEDLGGGVKAIFTLDSYININSGDLSNAAASLANNPKSNEKTVSAASSLNGQLFNNQAFVGLQDSTLGKVTLGRQWSLGGDILRDYDAVQDAQLFSPLGFSGTYAGGGITELKRQDNSIKYTNKIGDFNVGLMYKLGGVAGESSQETAYGVQVGYEAYGFGIQVLAQGATDVQTAGNAAGTVPGSVALTNMNLTSYMVAAKYAFGDAKIVAGYEQYSRKTPSDAFTTANVPTYYGYNVAAMSNIAETQNTNVIWVGGDYNFTPAFNLAVGFYDLNPQSYTSPAGETTSDGNEYLYSLLADYHLSKRTDVYAGVMYDQFKGGLYTTPGEYNTSNTIYAVGLRTKF